MYSWAAWEPSWTWSLALIAITIAIHVTGVIFILIGVDRVRARLPGLDLSYVGSVPASVAVIVAAALCLAILHGIEAIAWAIAYVKLGAVSSPAYAALYSVDSMSTRGSSGVILERQWTMMGAVEACDGMLLFGISTAFLFAVMVRLWKADLRIQG